MSFIGSGIEASLAQLAQVQRSAAESKDRERASSESARRVADSVRLRVGGIEHLDAVRRGDNDDLEKKNPRRRNARSNGRQDGEHDGEDRPSIDLTA